MSTTPVLDADSAPIGVGDVVAAHPEPGSQGSSQWQQEAARAAASRGLLGHRRARTEVAGLPALSGVQTPVTRHHSNAAKTQFQPNVLDLPVLGLVTVI